MSVAKMSVDKTSIDKLSVDKETEFLQSINGSYKKTFRSSKNQIGLVLFHQYMYFPKSKAPYAVVLVLYNKLHVLNTT